ncbi:hypothetical protein HK101_005299 [Irineochytrium annulatum]|nr:hypothetical protein HK101_005299 [Irineochytrium annulatum]
MIPISSLSSEPDVFRSPTHNPLLSPARGCHALVDLYFGHIRTPATPSIPLETAKSLAFAAAQIHRALRSALSSAIPPQDLGVEMVDLEKDVTDLNSATVSLVRVLVEAERASPSALSEERVGELRRSAGLVCTVVRSICERVVARSARRPSASVSYNLSNAIDIRLGRSVMGLWFLANTELALSTRVAEGGPFEAVRGGERPMKRATFDSLPSDRTLQVPTISTSTMEGGSLSPSRIRRGREDIEAQIEISEAAITIAITTITDLQKVTGIEAAVAASIGGDFDAGADAGTVKGLGSNGDPLEAILRLAKDLSNAKERLAVNKSDVDSMHIQKHFI